MGKLFVMCCVVAWVALYLAFCKTELVLAVFDLLFAAPQLQRAPICFHDRTTDQHPQLECSRAQLPESKGYRQCHNCHFYVSNRMSAGDEA